MRFPEYVSLEIPWSASYGGKVADIETRQKRYYQQLRCVTVPGGSRRFGGRDRGQRHRLTQCQERHMMLDTDVNHSGDRVGDISWHLEINEDALRLRESL